MAASTKITADFTSDTSGMQTGIARITGMFNKLTKTSSKTKNALSRMASGINFLVFDRLAQYALLAARAFKNLVMSSIKSIDSFDKLAKSTGISTEGLQVFALAAQKAGVGQQALTGAFGRMSKRLAEASQGFGEALPALKRLGISVEDLIDLSPEEQFMLIGQAIGGLATEGEQAAAAFKIFSDQGLALVPLFGDMAEQVQAAREELERFGGILSDQQVVGVVALQDNLTDVQQIFKNITNQVTANLAPAINAIVDAFKEFVSSAGGANIGKSISDSIIAAVDYLLGAVDYIAPVFAGIFGLAEDTSNKWSTVGYLLESVFVLADKVVQLWLSGFYTIQSIVLTLQSKIVSMAEVLVKAADALGFDTGGTKQFLKEFKKGLDQAASDAWEKALKANDAVWNGSEDEGPVAGGWQEAFRKFLEQQQANRPKEPQPGELPTESNNALTAQNKLVGLDARSSAGLNFLLQSGVAGNTVEDKQLATQKQIAKNTAQPGINVVQMGIA